MMAPPSGSQTRMQYIQAHPELAGGDTGWGFSNMGVGFSSAVRSLTVTQSMPGKVALPPQPF